MSKRILIIGSGFAGLQGALGAARVFENEGKTAGVEIALVAPEPVLHMRPRLHEREPERMGTPITAQLEAVGVRYIEGTVERIHELDRRVEAVTVTGERIGIDYDRLLLTTGSKTFRPDVPGLWEHAFSVDQYDEAVALDKHLKGLAKHAPTAARNTVVSLDENGVTTADGKRIDAMTVGWTRGVRANALAEQIVAQRDHLGRLHVSADLRVNAATGVFAAGDVAVAATDDQGNHTMMACQHAIDLGRYAGHNIAADLLGLPVIPYRQPFDVTCLNLGAWGAVYTEGWERDVKMLGAKALKTRINTEWIYPPRVDRATLLEAADWQNSAVA